MRWAWTVGGLGVALVPLLGFMSGAVNPDSMLYAVTAASFYSLARAFRRGSTRSSALALGALVAIGLATKLNFVGIAPGVLLGLILLSVRASRTHGRAAYVSLAMALAVAFGPAALYLAFDGSALSFIEGAVASVHAPLPELSYIWQLYLPRLPGMHADFGGVLTSQIWFNWYVGLYGWLDTTFPRWVYEASRYSPAVLIAVLCIRELVVRAHALRQRAVELGCVLRDERRAIGADRRQLVRQVPGC